MEIKVLDKGFLRLVDHVGDDARIVQAARVSYGSGTKTTREDAALINYLIKNDHGTPLEMVDFTFHLKAPLFVIGQWARHRMSSTNQMSARYSVMTDDFHLPEPTELRAQSTKNKQVGEGAIEDVSAWWACEAIEEDTKRAYKLYERLLTEGVSREQARMVLPQNLYSEMYWKANLRSIFNFLNLRLNPHAQTEIRVYAIAMAEIVKSYVPIAYEAFENHVLNAVKLSQAEKEVFAWALLRSPGVASSIDAKARLELFTKLGIQENGL